MHAESFDILRLAITKFLRDDQTAAQRLVQCKARLRELDADASALTVQWLRDATLASRRADPDAVPATPDVSGVLRVLRGLRRIYSHLASFAYPVPHRAGTGVRAPGRSATARGMRRRSGDAGAVVPSPQQDPPGGERESH